MNEAFNLARLQKMDTQIDQIDHRLVEISKILADHQELTQAEDQERTAMQALEKARHVLKNLEQSAGSQQVKIELSEAALYGGKVQNPKELQDLQTEVASLKRHLAVLEDQQLEGMLAVEAKEKEQNAANDNLTRVKAQFASQSATILGEQSKLMKDRERLLAERAPAAGQLSPTNIATYDRLRRQKHGVAVAGIVEGCCTACGSNLPPAEWQAARSPQQIVFCSFCGRILYAG